jgi:hypothetical protein
MDRTSSSSTARRLGFSRARRKPDVSTASKSRLAEASRNPLVVTLVGFLCTGILGAFLTWWLNSRSHVQDIETSIRDNAIAAVSDISDLVNERRERGMLVVSAIRRGAPETEVVARKTAYDEAYIRWNAKVPGDLLRIRAGFQWSRSRYEKYIDGLTNTNILLHGSDASTLLHTTTSSKSRPVQYYGCMSDSGVRRLSGSFISPLWSDFRNIVCLQIFGNLLAIGRLFLYDC